ncbi:sulfatase-like hydrolase/transferase [bacterium]|nr:sulfatase-like hydrolase/transferase [bacterium]
MPSSPAAGRPHVILVCADQHRADTLGTYGNRICQTPHLDRFAGQGVVLDRCFAQNPVCSPSRATIISGLLSRNHGVRTNGYAMPRRIPTLADRFGAAGYRTAAVGKTHLSPQNEGVPSAPHYGFDHLDPCEDNKVGPYLDWALKEFPEYEGYLLGTLFNLPTNEDYWQGKRDFRKEYLQARERHVRPLEISPTCNWGYGHYSALPEAAHHNTWITDRAIAQIDATGDQPLFLWVGYVEPHNPFDPPPRFRERYRPGAVPPPVGSVADDARLPIATRALREYFRSFTAEDHQVLRALYYGSVTFLDEQFGRLLAALDQRLDPANTIVVYLADHGELLADHGLYGKSCYHYDPSIRVPCICRGDGRWPRGARWAGVTELTDLAPTLLEAAGINGNARGDGVSFAAALRDPTSQPPRQEAFIESYAGGPEDPTPAPLTWAKTIRSARWRATFFPPNTPGELYDLENDPQELENLWFDPAHRAVIEEHRRLLLDRLVLADLPLPPRPWGV